MWRRPGSPVWRRLQVAEDDEVRRENRATQGDLRGWHPFESRWSTRRGWPNEGGWLVLAFVALYVLAVAVGTLRTGRFVEGLTTTALATVVAVGITRLVPWLHESKTATWILRMSADWVSFEKITPGGASDWRSITRVEAGELAVGTAPSRTSRHHGSVLEYVAGRSVDGATEIVFRPRSVSTGGFLGLFRGVEIATALVSWWPVNSRSVEALFLYEESGFRYWNPSGLVEGPRVMDAKAWDSRSSRR